MYLLHVESDKVALLEASERLTSVWVGFTPDFEPKAGAGAAQLS
jgi:hypothetical protein